MTLDTQAKAAITTATLSAGQHIIKAEYSGDSNFNGSSGEVTQTVNKATLTITLNGTASSISPGQAVTFTVSLTSSAGTPTGSVTFKDGSTILETKSLDATGKATITNSSLSLGQHSITAEYAGDINFTNTTSSAFVVNVSQQLTITTSSLPKGVVGTNYSFTLEASGGTSPYSWSRTAGNLPDNLTLNSTGTISGVPTNAGTFSFTVQLTDNSGAKVTKEFSILIENPIPTISSINPTTKFVGDTSFTLTVTGTNFVSGSKVRWNGSERNTTFVNNTQLTAVILATDIAAPGTAQVTVLNPTPGGGVSNALELKMEVPTAFEGDMTPRPLGDGKVTMTDWVQMGRFVVGLDTLETSGEFQRADCAPRATGGDGFISLGDWVQAGRYAIGLDPIIGVMGPSKSVATAQAPIALNIPLTTETEARTIRIVGGNFQRGKVEVIQIELEAQGNENALSFSLTYDPKLMSYVDTVVGNGANGAVLQINRSQVTNGRVGFAIVLPPGQQLLAGKRTLLNLRFIPNGGDGDIVSTISFSDQLLAREIVDVFATPISQVNYIGSTVAISGRAAATVSAASYVGAELAADSIASAFGTNLAVMTAKAVGSTLPTSLGGTSVKIKDALGIERSAALFFVSPLQINYQIPAGTAEGIASVTITNGAGEVITGLLNVSKVAPGIFTADSSGKGWAAGEVVYVRSDQSQVIQPIARFNSTQNQILPVPIDLSGDAAVLVLYGTGIRQREGLSSVQVKIGGMDAGLDYADKQGQYAGLDQINVRLSKLLLGRGEVNVEVTVEGKAANVIRILLK